MTENDQNNHPAFIGKKKGVAVYKYNPSVPTVDGVSKKKKVKFGNEKRGFILDNDTGEVLNVGGAGFYEFEEVDDTKFVKLFLDGVRQATGLSKPGMSLFELVYRELQSTPGQDEVKLNYYTASDHIEGLAERTFYRGLKDLLDNGFLFKSAIDGVYFVNITYMFNGDRLAFVKGFHRKSSISQSELDFDS